MLVNRGLQVMNLDVVDEAYVIASNYLRQSGAIGTGNFASHDRLRQIILQVFRRGEFNKVRLANEAIARFETGLREENA